MMMATWLAETCRSYVLMYVPCVVYSLLFRPTNTQYIISNVYFVKHSDMFRCIYTYVIFRESFLVYVKVTK